MMLFVCALVALPLALALVYAIYIQHERGGWWTGFKLAGLIGYPLDVVANYTTLALIFWAWPKSGAYTFSKQLHHLIQDNGLRGFAALKVAKFINKIAPSGKHIDI